jgi:hypothetical protein
MFGICNVKIAKEKAVSKLAQLRRGRTEQKNGNISIEMYSQAINAERLSIASGVYLI